MHRRRSARDIAAAWLTATAISVLVAGTASAHGQTVDPRGGDNFLSGPISRKWAQAHCHAQAPSVVSVASGGVVTFTPAEAKPCLDTDLNPGGQVTGP